jgi:hypothetical protein
MELRAVARQTAYDKDPGLKAKLAANPIQSDGQDDDDTSPVADKLFTLKPTNLTDLIPGLDATGIENEFRRLLAVATRNVLRAHLQRPRAAMPAENARRARGKKRKEPASETPPGKEGDDKSAEIKRPRATAAEADSTLNTLAKASDDAGSEMSDDDRIVKPLAPPSQDPDPDSQAATPTGAGATGSGSSGAATGSGDVPPPTVPELLEGEINGGMTRFCCSLFKFNITNPSGSATIITATADSQAIARVFPGEGSTLYSKLSLIPSQSCEELMRRLDVLYSHHYFRVGHNGLICQGKITNDAGLEVTLDLFQKMGMVPCSDLNKMLGSSSDLIGTNGDWKTITMKSATIRVPNVLPLFLYEIGRSTTLFEFPLPPKPKGRRRPVLPAPVPPAPGSLRTGRPMPAGKMSMYRFDFPETMTGAMVSVPGTGIGGGGGEFRTDPAAEFDYRWHYEPGASPLTEKTLVAACGLRTDVPWKLADATTDPGADFERIVAPIAGLTYWRRWKPERKDKRRNLPVTTLPCRPLLGGDPVAVLPDAAAPADQPVVVRQIGPAIPFTKAEMRRQFPAFRFERKSRKGAWNLARIARDTIPLRRQGARDDAAGSVMGRALVALGVPDAEDFNGAATRYTTAVVDAEETKGNTFWRTFSGTPKVRTGHKEPHAATILRTAQEWCHLQGHGDGGTETLENFVSGSKHANSEQLAIESGQRPWFRDADVSAKITAFMLPATPIVRTALSTDERRSLLEAGFVADDFTPYEKFRTTFADVLKPFQTVHQVAVTDREAALTKLYEEFAKKLPPAVKTVPLNGGPDARRWLAKRVDEIAPMLWLPQPIAFAVRYRVYVSVEGEPKARIVDHFIQMQRESFDVLEYRFLFWNTQLSIAAEIDRQIEVITKAKAAADAAAKPADPVGPQPMSVDPTVPAAASNTMMEWIIDKMANSNKAPTPPPPKPTNATPQGQPQQPAAAGDDADMSGGGDAAGDNAVHPHDDLVDL